MENETKMNLPIMLENQPENEHEGGTRFFRAILPVLFVIVIIELVLGVKTLLTPIPAAGKLIGFSAAEIKLTSDRQSYNIGDQVPVSIRVSTGGRSSVGVDIVLNYDPNLLEVTPSGSFGRGQIFQDYPIININNKAGQIRISGIDSPGQPGFSGIGVFGEVLFKAKGSGNTKVSLAYQKGSTDKSNIIENRTAQNVLGLTDDLSLNIGTGQSSSTQVSTNVSCAPRSLSVCTDDQGMIGSSWCTSINDSSACPIGCYLEQTGSAQGCKVTSAR